MGNHKRRLPAFLRAQCTESAYLRWLHRKAAAHVRRDRKRGLARATVSAYKAAIHGAVVAGKGLDAYTGQRLAWHLLSRYDNAKSKVGRTRYKHRFGDLPTVDHVGGAARRVEFKICAWRTNDAKHDLTYMDFFALCRAVVAQDRRNRRKTKARRASKVTSERRSR